MIMEYFIQSDVARLILGYLKEKCYTNTYQCFLTECSHLNEVYSLVKAGRTPRQISPLNLIVILEEWGMYKYQHEPVGCAEQNLAAESHSSDDTTDGTLVHDNDVTNSGRKTTKPNERDKKSPQVTKIRSSGTNKASKANVKSPRTRSSSREQCKSRKNTELDCGSPERNCTNYRTPIKRINEYTPKKSNTPPTKHINFEKSSKKVVVAVQEQVFTESNETVDRSIKKINNVPSADFAVPAHSEEGTAKTDLSERLNNKNSEGNTCNIGRKEKRKNEKDATVSGMKKTKIKTCETSEPPHSKCKETTTTTQCDDQKADNKRKCKQVQTVSKTYIKPTAEPPSGSVVSGEDRCMSWISRNNSENLNGETGESNNTAVTVTEERTDEIEEDVSPGTDESSFAVASKSSSTDNINTKSDPAVVASTSQAMSNAVSLVTPKKSTPAAAICDVLVTPVKLILLTVQQNTSKSPHRKKPKTPRKRTSEVSPVSILSTKSVEPSSVNPMFEKILTDHRLHEKLAETCNIVHNQMKLTNSCKENKADVRLAKHECLLPTHPSHDRETVKSSRSLEEILGIDHNFHTELLGDNIDMSDPAYESLFKLFGTNRTTFNEYLRREKERELMLMEAEVEELERSNHEILCANFGVSDAGYETQELAYNSPQHMALGSQQDLFSTQPGSHNSNTHRAGQATSIPCEDGLPVNFTPLLCGNEIGGSPVHSSPCVLSGLHKNGDNTKFSPHSTATQAFSPTYSNSSEMNNPPTPRNQQKLMTYVNGSCHGDSPYGPNTPRHQHEDPYSNPGTPRQTSSPHISQMIHSTPTGPDSVRSHANSDHFHNSSPIHPENSTMSNAPTHFSPLVKSDIHPGSPMAAPNGKSVFQPNRRNDGLYFNSQVTTICTRQNGQNLEHNPLSNTGAQNFIERVDGYLNLLNDDEVDVAASREACSTIENTIGCISLPEPAVTNVSNAGNGGNKSRRKGKCKKSAAKTFSTLKGLLSKPINYPNTIPFAMTAAELHQALLTTPEKRIPLTTAGDQTLTFRSPGGKTLINAPILNCDEIDLSVLGMEDNIDADCTHTINVYNQSFDSPTRCSIAPEYQATHDLVSAIAAGNPAEIVKQIQQRKGAESKPKVSATKPKVPRKPKTGRKNRKKKNEPVKEGQPEEELRSTPLSTKQPNNHVQFEPTQELYTATPFISLNKAATVRALNFGPNVDDPNIAHYRKIYPKLQTPNEKSPSVLILNANQVIHRGQKVVVNTTPATLVPGICNASKGKGKPNNDNILDTDNEQKLATLITKNATRVKETTDTFHKISMKRVTRAATSPKCKVNAVKNNVNVEMNSDTNVQVNVDSSKRGKRALERLRQSLGESMRNETKADKKFELKVTTANTNKSKYTHIGLEAKVIKKQTPRKGTKENQRVCIASKIAKNKQNKEREMLKVKIPITRHRSSKRNEKCKQTSFTFHFKKKTEEMVDDSSSDDDLPLSEIKKRQKKISVNSRKTEEKCKFTAANIEIESESTDEESQNVNKSIPSTPLKIETGKDSSVDNRTPSKEILLEKIGLTPKKSLVDHEFKSPNKANALDVLVEWQSSQKFPVSPRSRMLSPRTCKISKVDDRMKSPTPKQRTPVKQLFGSPASHNGIQDVKYSKAIQTAKRVDGIIDILKQNNPGRNLSRTNSKKRKSNLANSNECKSNLAVSKESNPKLAVDKSDNGCCGKAKAVCDTNENRKKQGSESSLIVDRSETEETSGSKDTSCIQGTNENRRQLKLRSHNSNIKRTDDKMMLINRDVNQSGAATTTEMTKSKLSEVRKKCTKTNPKTTGEISGKLENPPENTECVDIEDGYVVDSICKRREFVNVDENSCGAGELNRAIASIEVCQTDIVQEDQFPVPEYDGNDYYLYQHYESVDTDILSAEESNSRSHYVAKLYEINEASVENESSKHIVKPILNCNMRNSKVCSSQVIYADVHAVLNSPDLPKSTELHRSHVDNTDEPGSCTLACKSVEIDARDRETRTSDDPRDTQKISELEMQSKHLTDIKKKERKKKHRHKHRHRSHRSDTNCSHTDAGDSLVSPAAKDDDKHHHRIKKKKSKKRHREGREDGSERKRRRKEKSAVSLDSLAALNVEEALSQIYSGQQSEPLIHQ